MSMVFTPESPCSFWVEITCERDSCRTVFKPFIVCLQEVYTKIQMQCLMCHDHIDQTPLYDEVLIYRKKTCRTYAREKSD